jgi:chromosomal replication initiation ATPase DnaA
LFIPNLILIMGEQKEIETLLKNIQEGLKKFTLKELNEAIVDFFNRKDDKSKEINIILDLVCADFDTSLRILKKKNVRGDISEGKQLAYCLLHYNLGLSTRYIAEKVFIGHWHSVVYKANLRLKNAQPNIKSDREFLERYQKLNEQFIDKLTESNKKLEYEH